MEPAPSAGSVRGANIQMSVREIRLLDDPVLRQKAKRVRIIDGSIEKLIDDMLETLRDVAGVGLAATQVGVPLRVCVIRLPDSEDDIVLINPQMVRKTGERVIVEGCLSIPGYVADVTRAESVRVKGRDRHGKEIRVKGDELLAQALEHELDHLNGVLYIDHLESLDELRKVEPPSEEDAASADAEEGDEAEVAEEAGD